MGDFVLRQGSRKAIKAGLQLVVNEYLPNDEDFKLIGVVLNAISTENPAETLASIQNSADIRDDDVAKG